MTTGAGSGPQRSRRPAGPKGVNDRSSTAIDRATPSTAVTMDGTYPPAGPDGPGVPVWKENWLVLAALYPLVMVHTLLVAPQLEWAGTAAAMLLGNVVTVGLLGWPVLGTLRRTMGWWLHAPPGDRTTDRRGLALLVGWLACVLAATAALDLAL